MAQEMARRTITDIEIGLIKAMLRRGMRNRDIQFYFNRQDRPVNSGRITNIRTGTYGPNVPEATVAELDHFLESFVSTQVITAMESSALADRARARFVRRKDSAWYLADGETSEQECKAEFVPKRLEPIIRAIAALANNRGGFIFIGVSDADARVTGMQGTAFQDTDVVRITDRAKTLLSPTPIFSKDVIELGGALVGVLHVEKHPHPPVIVCRDANGLEDGAILFRYPGQSAKIKFGDLLDMLRERDRAAQQVLLTNASRLTDIGPDQALIVDTDKAELAAGDKRIVIDRALAEQLEFIREGQFDERQGAPTLKLMGEVHTVGQAGQAMKRVEGRALSADMALLAYLDHEAVFSPMQYIRLSALVQRQWLPLFYFIRLAGTTIGKAINALESTEPVYNVSKREALARLHGRRTAYSEPKGTIVQVVNVLENGKINDLKEHFTDIQIVRGIQSLRKAVVFGDPLFDLLKEIYQNGRGNANVRSGTFRAAARLDELEMQRSSGTAQ